MRGNHGILVAHRDSFAKYAEVIVWALQNGAGLRPLFDEGLPVVASVHPGEAIFHSLRRRDVRTTLVSWAGFAANRWPVSWSRATGFCRAWMMEQARLYQAFDVEDTAAHAVAASVTPDPGHTAELTDLLAVGRISRREKPTAERSLVVDDEDVVHSRAASRSAGVHIAMPLWRRRVL